MDRPIVANASGHPIVVNYDIPTWRNAMKRVSIHLSIENDQVSWMAGDLDPLSAEALHDLLSWIQEKLVGRVRSGILKAARETHPIWREAAKVVDEAEAKVAGAEAGKLFLRAFEAQINSLTAMTDAELETMKDQLSNRLDRIAATQKARAKAVAQEQAAVSLRLQGKTYAEIASSCRYADAAQAEQVVRAAIKRLSDDGDDGAASVPVA